MVRIDYFAIGISLLAMYYIYRVFTYKKLCTIKSETEKVQIFTNAVLLGMFVILNLSRFIDYFPPYGTDYTFWEFWDGILVLQAHIYLSNVIRENDR